MRASHRTLFAHPQCRGMKDPEALRAKTERQNTHPVITATPTSPPRFMSCKAEDLSASDIKLLLNEYRGLVQDAESRKPRHQRHKEHRRRTHSQGTRKEHADKIKGEKKQPKERGRSATTTPLPDAAKQREHRKEEGSTNTERTRRKTVSIQVPGHKKADPADERTKTRKETHGTKETGTKTTRDQDKEKSIEKEKDKKKDKDKERDKDRKREKDKNKKEKEKDKKRDRGKSGSRKEGSHTENSRKHTDAQRGK